MKTARKPAARRRPARRAPAPLSLTMRVERLEKAVLFPPVAAPAPNPAQRFTKLGADGRPTTGAHVAVLDAQTGLIWSAEPLQGGKDLNHADALKACTELELAGAKDWRAPTIRELLSIVDYDRYDPAVDPEYFKGPYGWTWTSTPYKGAAGCAWYVALNSGGSLCYDQGGHGHVRAVRAGQQLGLLE